jgi:hypothetical protein
MKAFRFAMFVAITVGAVGCPICIALPGWK